MNPAHRLIIPDIQEAEARGLWVQGMPGLHSAFKVNLSNLDPVSKNNREMGPLYSQQCLPSMEKILGSVPYLFFVQRKIFPNDIFIA